MNACACVHVVNGEDQSCMSNIYINIYKYIYINIYIHKSIQTFLCIHLVIYIYIYIVCVVLHGYTWLRMGVWVVNGSMLDGH